MGDQKCFIFGLQTRSLREGEEEEGEAEEEGETKTRYGFSYFCMEIIDSSMILVHELLGYGLLGFYLDINLVPLSGVLLGRHPNSRFKGGLVEKP